MKQTQILILAAALLAPGCTVRTITVGGNSYTSKRFGNAEKIGVIEFRNGTNSLRVEGWTSDQVTLAKEVTAAAVSAAMKGVAP